MKPVNEMAIMGVLDGLAGLTDRNVTVLLSRELGPLLVKKHVSDHDEGPKAENGVGRQQLIVVQSQHILAILKEDFNFPAHGNMTHQSQGVGLQVTGCPE